MAEAHERAEWNRAAQLLAMIYNAHRGPKARVMKPAEFHPMSQSVAPKVAVKDLSILRQVFVKE